MQTQLDNNYRIAADVSPEISRTGWWKSQESELPNWSSACKSVLLLQPSSGATERVFSLLTNTFQEQQTKSLEDYIEASLMMQYNVDVS